jgi:hypothetical protein
VAPLPSPTDQQHGGVGGEEGASGLIDQLRIHLRLHHDLVE